MTLSQSNCLISDDADLLIDDPVQRSCLQNASSTDQPLIQTPYKDNYREGFKVSRILLRPRPGFYVMRLQRGAPLVPALIYQLCPMVIPQPTTVDGPNPYEWCRPLDRSPRYGAQIDGKRVPVERVWTASSLRRIGAEEYAFRMGPLRRWARTHPEMPEARPESPVDLAALPPLF
jgi:hypothetical protein